MATHRKTLRAATLAMAFAAMSLQANAQDDSKDYLVQIFTLTCMQHLYKNDQLPAFMSSTGAMGLEPDQSHAFLQGKKGKAWAIPIRMGNYVVSLTDQGMCSAYARTGNVSQIENGFRDLVTTAPAPLRSVEIKAEPTDKKNRRLSYNWIRSEQDSTAINFTLTYSTSSDSQLRALISAAVVTR